MTSMPKHQLKWQFIFWLKLLSALGQKQGLLIRPCLQIQIYPLIYISTQYVKYPTQIVEQNMWWNMKASKPIFATMRVMLLFRKILRPIYDH